jgi:hypothetical protein
MRIIDRKMELGSVTTGMGTPSFNDAVIYFEGLDDTIEINIEMPGAQSVAEQIVKLWNDALVEKVA